MGVFSSANLLAASEQPSSELQLRQGHLRTEASDLPARYQEWGGGRRGVLGGLGVEGWGRELFNSKANNHVLFLTLEI